MWIAEPIMDVAPGESPYHQHGHAHKYEHIVITLVRRSLVSTSSIRAST